MASRAAWAEPVDAGAAEAAMEFLRLESGEAGPVPAPSWKCRACEVWEDCVLAVR